MPMYEYECRDCKKIFMLALSLQEHDQSKPACSGCGSKNVEQMISSFIAKTASKT